MLQGAKHLIRQAVDAELQELLGKFKHCCTQDGKAAVVRNGYHPELSPSNRHWSGFREGTEGALKGRRGGGFSLGAGTALCP